MNDQPFLQVQAIQLRQLLEDANDDLIIAPQLRERLNDVEAELRAAQPQQGSFLPPENAILPRAAIFLRGGGVQGSQGIRPSLAGEALIQYERMFTEQALHDERDAARTAGRHRRPRGAETPTLLFTGTPRGSFGLEFVPQTAGDESLRKVHAQSLHNVADAILRVAGAETSSLDDAIKSIPSRVLQPLKQFLRTLAQHRAELRLAFHDSPSQKLDADQIGKAADRLDRNVQQEAITVQGVFRGVTRESGIFDLLMSDNSVVTGVVVDDFTEEDLERIDLLTNQSCIAELQKTTVRTIVGAGTPTFVLIDAQPLTTDEIAGSEI